jgi:hypothetical protein
VEGLDYLTLKIHDDPRPPCYLVSALAPMNGYIKDSDYTTWDVVIVLTSRFSYAVSWTTFIYRGLGGIDDWQRSLQKPHLYSGMKVRLVQHTVITALTLGSVLRQHIWLRVLRRNIQRYEQYAGAVSALSTPNALAAWKDITPPGNVLDGLQRLSRAEREVRRFNKKNNAARRPPTRGGDLELSP